MIETMPEAENKDSFVNALAIIANPENHVFISLVPPFELSFEIDKDILKTSLQNSKITREDFKKSGQIISSLLLAILRKQEKGFVKFYLENQQAEDGKEDEKSLLEKMDQVRSHLYNPQLQNRYDLKKSSKAPSFTNIDWDIKIKAKDSKVDEIKYPYVTCKLIYQKIFEYSPYYVLGGPAIDAIQINFAKDDVDYLIRVLEKVKSHLQAIEEEIKI